MKTLSDILQSVVQYNEDGTTTPVNLCELLTAHGYVAIRTINSEDGTERIQRWCFNSETQEYETYAHSYGSIEVVKSHIQFLIQNKSLTPQKIQFLTGASRTLIQQILSKELYPFSRL